MNYNQNKKVEAKRVKPFWKRRFNFKSCFHNNKIIILILLLIIIIIIIIITIFLGVHVLQKWNTGKYIKNKSFRCTLELHFWVEKHDWFFSLYLFFASPFQNTAKLALQLVQFHRYQLRCQLQWHFQSRHFVDKNLGCPDKLLVSV